MHVDQRICMREEVDDDSMIEWSGAHTSHHVAAQHSTSRASAFSLSTYKMGEGGAARRTGGRTE